MAVSPLCSARPSRVVAISPQRPFSRRMFAEEARPAVFDAIEQYVHTKRVYKFRTKERAKRKGKDFLGVDMKREQTIKGKSDI